MNTSATWQSPTNAAQCRALPPVGTPSTHPALAHELASLSSIIRVLTEILETRSHELTDSQRAVVANHIRECSLQLNELIGRNWISDDSQAARGTCSEKLNVCALCERIIEQLHLTRPDSARIQFLAGSRQARAANFAPNLMRSIVMNLLTNALKYSPPDEPVLLVIDADKTHLIVQVADRGIGIAPEDIAHVFEPKYRASGVNHIAGTGMGLYIVKRACELLHGSITVESTLGLGTIFTVKLPA